MKLVINFANVSARYFYSNLSNHGGPLFQKILAWGPRLCATYKEMHDERASTIMVKAEKLFTLAFRKHFGFPSVKNHCYMRNK